METETFQLLDNIFLTVPKNPTKVCVNVSGGADSALLLYLLVKHLHHNSSIVVFTNSRKMTKHYNSIFSTKVVSAIIRATGTDMIKEHIICYHHDQDREQMNQYEGELFRQNKIEISYVATTQNPPLTETGLLEGRVISRDPGHGRATSGIAYEVLHYLPFMDADKKSIFALYQKYDLMDWLFDETKSCESYDINVNGHCGICWWCRERIWGFGSL